MSSHRRRSAVSILAEIAEAIKDRFVAEYRRKLTAHGGYDTNWKPGPTWNGGKVQRSGRTYSSVWERTAKWIIRHKIPIAEYIYFIVWDYKPRSMPLPGDLTSEKALLAFRKQRQGDPNTLREQHETAFSSQKAVLSLRLAYYAEAREMDILQLTNEELQRAIIEDPYLELSALFRYCLAYSEDLHDLADRLFLPAVYQYTVESDHYDEVWKDWIPDEFRRKARRLDSVER